MNDTGAPEIDVDALMTQIREEVTRSEGSSGAALEATSADSGGRSQIAAAARVERGSLTRLGDFSQSHGADFLGVAYRVVLNRSPDAIGEQYYLRLLRNGASKAEILGRLRYSAEGRRVRASIEGLGRAYFLDKLSRAPIVGPVWALFSTLWALPNRERRLRVIESEVMQVAASADRQIESARKVAQDALDQVNSRLRVLAEGVAERATAAEVEEIRRALKELHEARLAADNSRNDTLPSPHPLTGGSGPARRATIKKGRAPASRK